MKAYAISGVIREIGTNSFMDGSPAPFGFYISWDSNISFEENYKRNESLLHSYLSEVFFKRDKQE